MRAAYFDRYGSPDVIAVREVLTPKPGPREVRIAVRATTATAACGMMRRGDTAMARVLLGALRPRRRFRILGIELCGVVDRVGTAVARFKEGDRVFGFAGFRPGAYAEYMCLAEDASVAPAPQHLSDLLRAETGESAREHIRRALIEQRSAGWQRRPRKSARSPTRLASSNRSTSIRSAMVRV